jgi:competence protein ComFC
MRCLSCEKLSISIICKECQKHFLVPSLYKRELRRDFTIYSFYLYDEIKELLNTKYQFYGDRVYDILAKLSFQKFAKDFEYNNQIFAIPIDDHTAHQFSQTAILVNNLKSKNIKPIFNSLMAQNRVKFAGKNLEFRQKNSRNFLYTGRKSIQVILVDDLVTSGTTMLEAKKVLEENNCEVICGLTLSDASI